MGYAFSLLAVHQSGIVRNTHEFTFIESYIINSGSLSQFSMIAFMSAPNCTGVNMNLTPDHLFFFQTRVRFAKQCSHHPNELNSISSLVQYSGLSKMSKLQNPPTGTFAP